MIPEHASTEQARLEALLRSGLLDSNNDATFDHIVQLAAGICGVRIGAVTVVDQFKLLFKAAVGLGETEMPRQGSFCSSTVGRRVCSWWNTPPNTPSSDRVNPFWSTGSAFTPVSLSEMLRGFALGALCVLDTSPRQITPLQRNCLEVLAASVCTRVELARKQKELEEALVQQKELSQQVQTSDLRFRAFMDNAPFMGFIKDAKGRFIFYNQRLADQFGIERTTWLGQTVEELFPESAAAAYRLNDLAAMKAGGVLTREEETQDSEGIVIHWRTSKFPFHDSSGEILLGGLSIDNTGAKLRQRSLEAANDHLEELSSIDPLTNLLNRRSIGAQLERSFVEAKDGASSFAVLLLDIDDFKKFNDTHGHLVGDHILQQVAVAIRSVLRARDQAARYGGEEILVLLPGTNEEGAHACALRIRAALKGCCNEYGPVTVSAGATCFRSELSSVDDLIAEADDAMYRAKRHGKDRCEIHTLRPRATV